MQTWSAKRIKEAILMALFCMIVVAFGIFGMVGLASSKRPPAKKPPISKNLSVSVVPVEEAQIRLTAVGYGQAAPVNVTEICPQVSGNIVEKHPALDQGGMVEKGAVLIKIDDTDYDIEVMKARAQMALSENAIAQYRVSWERDKGRLKSIKKNTALAKAEYTRLKTLYETDRVGTLSGVESAEQSYNTLLDTEKILVKTISLYPLQINEAKSDLAKDKADFKTAELNLERCVIRAPFSGRVQSESVETGTYITASTTALTLADDSTLEIQVPLSDKDAFETLGLRRGTGQSAWFSGLDTINCRLESVTGKAFAATTAKIHRAVQYNAESRTLYLAVRVSGTQTQDAGSLEANQPPESGTDSGSVPLLDGMFCKVYFEGRALNHAVKAPRSSLNSDNTVFVARDMRLKTLAVETVMSDGDYVYVTGAFEPGDSLITTSLTNPIENSLLAFVASESASRFAMAPGGNTK